MALKLLRRKPPEFQVLAVDDTFIAPTILMGGVGAITASAHVCTNLFARMIDAARTGYSDTVMALANALLPVVTTGFAEPNPACWEAALHAAGQIATATLRLPMSQASDAATQRLLDSINDAHDLASALSP
ncbi:MAG TPA: dihydrodipicolinate synthase family protein [Acidimicrobiales bacterium]|nr:dihydrodipicolinate synthase family protein [Acidimicrobiales bacterium]